MKMFEEFEEKYKSMLATFTNDDLLTFYLGLIALNRFTFAKVVRKEIIKRMGTNDYGY
jgi:hypothetical protein